MEETGVRGGGFFVPRKAGFRIERNGLPTRITTRSNLFLFVTDRNTN
jgi:hypothetical protein